MEAQVYFEDIEVGEEIPHQVREPLSTRSLVKWAAAVRDFYEVHYDKDFARSIGLKDVIAHGPNKCALLGRLMVEWIGEQGRLHTLSCTHKASNFPGETLVCRGKIEEKYTRDGLHYVACTVWVENQEGVVAAPGAALVSLPSRM